MGLAMASNVQRYLQRVGKPALKIWNRTASRGTPLIALGAVACDSIASLVAGCDLIFISVSEIELVLHPSWNSTGSSVFRPRLRM